jgi:hypothetical protein
MLKVYSIHPSTYDVNSLLRYLHIDDMYDLVWDAESPEILFVSEWIYYKRDCFEQFRALFKVAKVKILLAFEAISPDWNLFDYAVGFDDHLQYGDRFIRIMSPFDMFNGFVSVRENEIHSMEQAKAELARKNRFCNFLYSNPNAHVMRDRLFYEISKYKQVDSLGRHLNNVNQVGTGYEGHSKDCVPMKSKFKFSIASENAAYPGYTSEKILTSLEAHTVPIYFGNPDIVDDVDPDAFINVSDFDNLESLVQYIEKVDNDDELWCKYVSSPWLTPKQQVYHKERTEEYGRRIGGLLTGDIAGKERLTIGTHETHYRRHFFEGTYHCDWTTSKKSYKYYVKKVLRRTHIIK